MKTQSISAAFAVVLSFSVHAVAQSQYSWLDDKPLPSWSARSRAILETKKISSAELTRCRNVIRPATLPVDRLLTKYNWTLVGDARVYGNTTAVTVAQGFDGMCRPLGFQTLVFVGNLVAGTLSPGTDGLAHRRFYDKRQTAFGNEFGRRLHSLQRNGPAVLSIENEQSYVQNRTRRAKLAFEAGLCNRGSL